MGHRWFSATAPSKQWEVSGNGSAITRGGDVTSGRGLSAAGVRTLGVLAISLGVIAVMSPARLLAASPRATPFAGLSDAKSVDGPNTTVGDKEYDTGHYVEAQNEFQHLLNVYGEQPRVLSKLAWALLMQGAYDDARAAFAKVDGWAGTPKKTLDVEKRNLQGMGHLSLEEGNFEEAEKYFRHAARIDPKDGQPRFEIALALFYENRLDECRKMCDAIKADKNAYHAQGDLLALRIKAKTGVADARQRAQVIVNENSTRDELHFFFGQMLEDMGDRRSALAQFRIARKLAPQRALYRAACEAMASSENADRGRAPEKPPVERGQAPFMP